jgi:hypothetical protein
MICMFVYTRAYKVKRNEREQDEHYCKDQVQVNSNNSYNINRHIYESYHSNEADMFPFFKQQSIQIEVKILYEFIDYFSYLSEYSSCVK